MSRVKDVSNGLRGTVVVAHPFRNAASYQSKSITSFAALVIVFDRCIFRQTLTLR